jgi:hypothetical protein
LSTVTKVGKFVGTLIASIKASAGAACSDVYSFGGAFFVDVY